MDWTGYVFRFRSAHIYGKTIQEKEAMNLKNSENGYMEGLVGKQGKEKKRKEMMQL